jgi:hypothetical protein
MPDAPAPPPRKKSQKRQRDHRISIPCTADEFNAVTAKATAAGMSYGAYARAAVLGDAGPRAQRRSPVDAQLLREVLAQHGKYGNNWNQIAYQLNLRAEFTKAADVEQAALEVRRALKEEWAPIRGYLLQALGRDPKEFDRPA